MTEARSFLGDCWRYLNQVRLFQREDWVVFASWVGLMLGLLTAVVGFIIVGWWKGVEFPDYVWNVPLGTFIFIVAIAVDTVGHRTAYKEELKKGESLVHHITIFAGITSILCLCLAYRQPGFFRIPAYCLVALSIFYSIIDEAMHWHRYTSGKSDRIEMWSHFFIFLGHTIMVVGWCYWFSQGYPGVTQTLVYFNW